MNAIMLPEKEIEKVLALSIVITSPESLEKAQINLSAVRLAGKNLAAAVKALKEPHQTAIKEIDTAAKPWKDKLESRDATLERAILTYNRQVKEAQEELQRKELAKYEKKVERVEAKALEQGKPIPVVLPPQVFATPPKTVQVEGSKQTTITRKCWRVRLGGTVVTEPEKLTARAAQMNLTGIPLQYFLLDTAAVGKIVRAGGIIPGVEVYEEESLSVRT